jgi:hypothetical protein
VTPDFESPGSTRFQKALEAENFIETYKIISEWIRFADAKAAVTLTVNGVFLGLLIPTLKAYLSEKSTSHPTGWWTALVVILFLGWLVWVLLSAISSFLCILPLRGRGWSLTQERACHFHPGAVSRAYSLNDLERFATDCEKLGSDGLKREVMAGILIDAHLSSEKYRHVTRAIWCLAIGIAFGLLYLLAIQF